MDIEGAGVEAEVGTEAVAATEEAVTGVAEVSSPLKHYI